MKNPDNNIIGLLNAGKIVSIKSWITDKDRNAAYILFSDKETVLELEEQDYYSYHDCSSSARILNVRKDTNLWNEIMSNPDFKDSLSLY